MNIQNQAHLDPNISTDEYGNQTITCYSVVTDRDMGSYRLLHCPLSPNFRTVQERDEFAKSITDIGAYKVRQEFCIFEDTDVEGLLQDIFGE